MVEINGESWWTCYRDNQISFKTSVLRSSLCDYGDAYIVAKGTVTVAKETDAAPNNANKKVIFKTCTPFTSCISRIKIRKKMMLNILM